MREATTAPRLPSSCTIRTLPSPKTGGISGDANAWVPRSADDRSVARNGVEPCLAFETAGHHGDEVRRDRQDGFSDPAVRAVLFYFVFGAAFGWPSFGGRPFFHSEPIAWAGVAACAAGLLLVLWSLVSFQQSFRIGIDADRPDRLITFGIFAFSRNPIYVAFALILIGEFLIFPHTILLAYIVGFVLLVHRQVLREEEYLKAHYGREYLDYCNRVRRYL
jgi:protein-S-isoprenylcysteine O-methyltransferase Ste14